MHRWFDFGLYFDLDYWLSPGIFWRITDCCEDHFFKNHWLLRGPFSVYGYNSFTFKYMTPWQKIQDHSTIMSIIFLSLIQTLAILWLRTGNHRDGTSCLAEIWALWVLVKKTYFCIFHKSRNNFRVIFT